MQLDYIGHGLALARLSACLYSGEKNERGTTMKLKQKPKHKLELKAVYDDGTISKKSTTFRLCK